MSEDPKLKIIRERQARIRAWMIHDRIHNPLFEMLVQSNAYGKAVHRRWCLFGQVALHKSGSLLTDDDVWTDLQNEMTIPSTLWMNALRVTSTGSAAQQILRVSSYRFPVTTWDNTVVIKAATWWDNKIRKVTFLEVLAWLGVIGGHRGS